MQTADWFNFLIICGNMLFRKSYNTTAKANRYTCSQAYVCVESSAGSACATCKPQAEMTIDNHCNTCNPGFFISGTKCKAHALCKCHITLWKTSPHLRLIGFRIEELPVNELTCIPWMCLDCSTTSLFHAPFGRFVQKIRSLLYECIVDPFCFGFHNNRGTTQDTM